MSAYRDILVAVGPLAERSAALERATALALRDGARLTVVSAAGSPPLFIWLVPGLPEHPLHALQHACEQRLRALARSMPPGLPVTTIVRHGKPATALLEELRDGAYDLVVIGSDEQRRWRRRSRYSRALVRRSPVSVLMAEPGRAAAAPDAQRGDDLVPARA